MKTTEVTKEDLKSLVEQCKAQETECEKAIIFMRERIKQAELDLLAAKTLIKKFG